MSGMCTSGILHGCHGGETKGTERKKEGRRKRRKKEKKKKKKKKMRIVKHYDWFE